MDHRKPHPPKHLLDDLKSIHALLDEHHEPSPSSPPFEPDNIPLLSDIVSPGAAPRISELVAPVITPASATRPRLEYLDSELRAAAQVILQEVIDDFSPQIEAELRRRLEARLARLQGRRNG